MHQQEKNTAVTWGNLLSYQSTSQVGTGPCDSLVQEAQPTSLKGHLQGLLTFPPTVSVGWCWLRKNYDQLWVENPVWPFKYTGKMPTGRRQLYQIYLLFCLPQHFGVLHINLSNGQGKIVLSWGSWSSRRPSLTYLRQSKGVKELKNIVSSMCLHLCTDSCEGTLWSE